MKLNKEEENSMRNETFPSPPPYIDFLTQNERNYEEIKASELSKVNPNIITEAPMLYLDRKLITLLMTRIKMYEMIIDVQGSVIECGVHRANSLMTYYHLSSILEPVAYNRKIIGFDTFNGFPSISEKDPFNIPIGRGLDTNLEHIKKWVSIQDLNRTIGHIPKIELIKGDACKTIPQYVEDNPHLILAMLYLDFDLYDPTLVALKHLLPLVVKGGLVGFDELNQRKWSGETIAFKEQLNIGEINLKRFYFDAHVSYFIRE